MRRVTNARRLCHVLQALGVAALVLHCGEDERLPQHAGSSGDGGTSSGGSSAEGGVAGQGAVAGSAGSDTSVGGSGGMAGGGSGGDAGSAGDAGSGQAGVSGSAGVGGGMAGAAGEAVGGSGGANATETFGFVRDNTTRQGLAASGVEFGLLDLSMATQRFATVEQRTTRTDAAGAYAFLADDVTPGWQRIVIDAPGYAQRIFYRNYLYTSLCGLRPCAPANFYLWGQAVVHDKLPDFIADPRMLLRAELSNSCDDLDNVSACLRLGIGAANIGEGDLWVTAPTTALTTVTQHIDRSDGSATSLQLPEANFIYHPEHGHLHFDGWSELELRKIDESCATESTAQNCLPIKQGKKLSFCLRDSLPVDDALPAQRSYTCGIDEQGRVTQGVGAGHMDVYGAELKGQFIDVTGLADGDYWLEVTVNPHAAVRESDLTNNTSRTKISLKLPECGNQTIEFPESCEASELNGASCQSVSAHFSGGTLKCNSSCGFDRSECVRASCNPLAIGSKLGLRAAEGSNAEAFDTLDIGRCENPLGTGRDVAYLWTAPKAGTYRFDTIGSDYSTMLYVLDGTCDGAELACNSDFGQNVVTLSVEAAAALVIVVDAHPGRIGNYVLNITEI